MSLQKWEKINGVPRPKTWGAGQQEGVEYELDLSR